MDTKRKDVQVLGSPGPRRHSRFVVFLILRKFCFSISFFSSPAIFAQSDSATPFIAGGRPALVGEFASDCSIDTPVQIHCQGILLANNIVLTAATCVTDDNSALIHPSLVRVTCGDNHLFIINPGREQRSVSHIYPHDQFDSNTNNNDLAILRLAQPIQLPHNTIEEAWIQERIVPEGTQCTFSGWGTSSNVRGGNVNPIEEALNFVFCVFFFNFRSLTL